MLCVPHVLVQTVNHKRAEVLKRKKYNKLTGIMISLFQP
jgi:hypothetical protein